MTLAAPSPVPRLAGATPVALLQLAADVLIRLVASTGRKPDPVGDRVLSVRLDVPSGEWLIWADRECALWIGDTPTAVPGQVRERFQQGTTADIVAMIDWLADAGVWCREATILLVGGWSAVRHADEVFRDLAMSGACALSGVFVDREGRSGSLELAARGACWTDRPPLAVEWLITAASLPPPT
jgi:hypothetical protein